MKKLILGSLSPRRAELIKQISGYDISIMGSCVQERIEPSKSALQNVSRLAMEKAQDVFDRVKNSIENDTFVLGVDTIVVVDDEILGKPQTKDEAIAMFKKLENKQHFVYTAVCFISKEKKIQEVGKTGVTFGALNDKIVYNYIKAGNSYDKAGGYGLQDFEIQAMITHIDGEIDNVIGLPVKLVGNILKENF